MSLEPEFLELASTTVTVTPLSTVSSYGAPVYSSSAAATYTAVVQDEVRRLRGPQGYEEVHGVAVYILSSSAAVSPADKLTIRGGQTPTIRSVFVEHDEDGQHHLEVFCAGSAG